MPTGLIVADFFMRASVRSAEISLKDTHANTKGKKKKGGIKEGAKCYVTTAFWGIPNAKFGGQKRKWSLTKGYNIGSSCLTLALSGAQRRAQMLRRPSILGDPQKREKTSKVAYEGPKTGRKCYVTPAFRGIPNAKRGEQNNKWSPRNGNKIRSGCLNPAFSGAQERAQMLCHPGILRDPQQRGTTSEVAASPLPSEGPKGGRKCYVSRRGEGSHF